MSCSHAVHWSLAVPTPRTPARGIGATPNAYRSRIPRSPSLQATGMCRHGGCMERRDVWFTTDRLANRTSGPLMGTARTPLVLAFSLAIASAVPAPAQTWRDLLQAVTDPDENDVAAEIHEVAEIETRRAAEQGGADALNKLGEMDSRGRDAAQDFSEAARRFHLAARRNNSRRAVQPRRPVCPGGRRTAGLWRRRPLVRPCRGTGAPGGAGSPRPASRRTRRFRRGWLHRNGTPIR